MLIVALDDHGMALATQLKAFNDRRMRDYWNQEIGFDEKWNKKNPDEQAKAEASLKKGRWFLGLFPYLRRILMPELQVFDLRGDFELAMSDIEEYLRNNTRFSAFWPGRKYALLQKGIAIYFIVGLFMSVVFFGWWAWFLVWRILL